MTSNDGPAPGPPAGRRRALGRGPGAHALPAEAARGAPVPAGTPRPHEPSADTDGPPPSTPDLPSRPPEPAAPDPGTEAEAEAQVSPPEPEAKAEPAVSVPGPETSVSEPEPEVSGPEPGTSAPEPPAPAPEPPAPVPAPVGPEPPVRVAGAAGDADSSGADVAGDGDDEGGGVFKVRLANFEGPFDLLLQLISRHKMDVTEVALSRVTDEFMAYIRAMGSDWDLDETTEFLVVAATLLDLKAARLLPAAEVEDEADLALLEARDLLFARLLQYRAYKQVADIFNRRLDEEARRHPRTVGLEPHHAELLPEVVISIGPEGFARLAVKAMQPRPRPQVYVDHIHAPLVSVQEQAGIVVARLRERGEADFRELVADTDDTLTVVARFLALLELYREKAVALEQETALGDLLVRWTGGAGEAGPTVTDEFDRAPRPPKEEKA
ncbi:segregation/condensation protein A [Streptomyces sp. NPDC096080]|uniref:segregation and condensation protein A n=1 Tax=Streptomyces sp. NPDC096080 TaxID=3156693 RepID=UPI0033234536